MTKRKDDETKSSIKVHVGGNATGNAIGDGAQVNAGIIAGGDIKHDDQLSKLFDYLSSAVASRPIDPKVDKEEILEAVQLLRKETEDNQEPDEGSIKRRLRAIERMAPDILDVIIQSFKGPVSGLIAVIQKVAQKVKEEAQQ